LSVSKQKDDLGPPSEVEYLPEPVSSQLVDSSPAVELSDGIRIVSYASSITSVSTSPSEIQSDDSELQQEAEVLTFIAKMKQNMSSYLQSIKERAQPVRYNKTGKPTSRTKRHQKQQIVKRTKAYWAAGYQDISSFFQRKASASQGSVEITSSMSDLEITAEPPTKDHQEEEEESSEENSVFLQREEEEEEDEEPSVGSIWEAEKISLMSDMLRSSPCAPTMISSQAVRDEEEEEEDLSESDDSNGKSHSEDGMRRCPPNPNSRQLQNLINILKKADESEGSSGCLPEEDHRHARLLEYLCYKSRHYLG